MNSLKREGCLQEHRHSYAWLLLARAIKYWVKTGNEYNPRV